MGTSVSQPSTFFSFWQRFKKQRLALISAFFLLLLALVSIFAPLLSPYDYLAPDYESLLEGASGQHWAGTDAYGRDIFSRILYGGRISLTVGLLSVGLGAIIGTLLGLVSGFYGRWLDGLIMRICDVLFAFPGIVLAIGIMALLGPGLTNVIYAVAIFSVPSFARLVRSSTLVTKQHLYVRAAQIMGLKTSLLLLRHLLPSTVPSAIVYFSLRIGSSILTAASLSFIGMGAQPPSPEWGAMLADGRSYLGVAGHVVFFPGVAILLTVFAFNLLGDGLREALDPRLN